MVKTGLFLTAIVLLTSSLASAAGPMAFGSPEEAFRALITAVREHDTRALLTILGPGARPLVSSGDPVADRQAGERLVQAYDVANTIEAGNGRVVLVVGKDGFPFPIPVVPDGPVWRFDTHRGQEEILARRIGRNELSAIQVCLAYTDAQREYYAEPRDGSGLLQFAQRLASSPGKHDGLYWETKAGEPPSPLGELVAHARAEGYGRERATGPGTYHGYQYRILTAQGPDAAGGAYDYVANGKMIGGFAMVAFPARWGASGVMTFLVSHDGVVYEKNLGPDTARLARDLKQFNPDSTWRHVEPAALTPR